MTPETASTRPVESIPMEEMARRLRAGFEDLIQRKGVDAKYRGIFGRKCSLYRGQTELEGQGTIPVSVSRANGDPDGEDIYVDIDYRLDKGERVNLCLSPRGPARWRSKDQPSLSFFRPSLFLAGRHDLELFMKVLDQVNKTDPQRIEPGSQP